MKNKLHFHSIDALRFFAFLKVYLLHIPLQGDFPIFGFLKSGGGIGVLFFFVLSGFLITYLLVREQVTQGKIRIRQFFIRRTLRIWPLFFLMVIVAFLLPYDLKQSLGLHMVGGGYDLDYRFSFTFLENYKMLIEDNVPKTTPLNVFWSLCIEEHFYLVWMVALFFLRGKWVLRFFYVSFLVGLLSRIAEPFLWNNTHVHTSDLFTNIDYFAAGGILGYWVAAKYDEVVHKVTRLSKALQWVVVISVIALVVFQRYLLPFEGWFFYIRPFVIAIMFTLLIALFIPKNSYFKIKSKALAYLGKISYGLYVYHIAVIHISLEYCFKNDITLESPRNLIVYVLFTFFFTVVLSALSYQYFELPFLRLRNKITARE